ncbi:adenosylcobinamide-GDP ribazoletransferase [Streptomyces sp. CA-111067]|uniref:adenosylcobinamide-GDP ribazoletransferase n=1 Tax=Streptomyces sp. CA-111067 TaxID=3240046 RepID=UPI003D9833C4
MTEAGEETRENKHVTPEAPAPPAEPLATPAPEATAATDTPEAAADAGETAPVRGEAAPDATDAPEAPAGVGEAVPASAPGEGPAVFDGLRFAFGTLTVIPVTVRRWDRAAAAAGMAAAPLVGLVVGGGAAAGGGLLTSLGASPLLAAIGAVAVPAVLTRGLHLDGLADTADGLGSGKPADEALRIMKQSDIGPFGVLTLILVLLAQTAALAACYADSWTYGCVAAVLAAFTGRTAMTLACRPAVPAARPGGLGAAVAGSVRTGTACALAVLAVAAGCAAGLPFGGLTAGRGAAAACLALLCAEALLRHCVRRFRGTTGDVFGALCETATTATLVVLSLR